MSRRSFLVVNGNFARSSRCLRSDGTTPAGLRLVDTRTSTTGVIMATYARAGDLAYGSFALEEPTEAEAERRRRLADSGQ